MRDPKPESMFDQIKSHRTTWILAGLGFIVAGIGIALFFSYREDRAKHALNELYLAENSLTEEMKTLGSIGPFSPLDVDAKLPKTVLQLKNIVKNYGSTRAALEARIKLGTIYFNHGEYEKAKTWFEQAADASSGYEKAVALSSLGYTYEDLGNYDLAIKTFQKALQLGEGGLKGDLLIAIARNYENMKDFNKARSIYDQILTELPTTEYAKQAEIAKSQLPEG